MACPPMGMKYCPEAGAAMGVCIEVIDWGGIIGMDVMDCGAETPT